MSTKEMLYARINMLSEEEMQTVLEWLDDCFCELNEETLAAIEDVEHGRNLVGPFCSVEELMEDLNADD